MSRILTTCPTTGESVPTGYRSADIDLADAKGAWSFRCSVCQQVHAWTASEARTEDTERFAA
jgi:hypothetical protein